MKICNKCKKEKPLIEFYRAIRFKDGYSYQCKQCDKEYKREHSEKIKEYMQKYRLEHKEYRNKQIKTYYKTHPRNSKNNKQARQIYRKTHKEKLRIDRQKRAAKKLELINTLTIEQWISIKEHFNNTCCYCGSVSNIEQDHLIPLSKNGEYSYNNIVPACKSCNASKGNRNFIEWYRNYIFYNKERETRILKYLNYIEGIQQLKISI